MASDEDKDTLYCICREPYNENEFMIECDECNDWFHGSCVGVLEHQAADIEIYHCPNCQVKHGPLVLKQRRNWHRHDYSDSGSAKAIQTGTVMFIKELKTRAFNTAEEMPMRKVHGSDLCKEWFDQHGFESPVLVEKKDGLGLIVPPPTFSIQDVEDLVGSMREIDVIDVARQEDYKMLMREWTQYYNSPNRDKIFNVISLEFSKTKLSDLVTIPQVVRELSWVCNGVWPDTLPDDCPYARPEVHKYCLMGVRDSFTDFHIDFGGTSVWYHVLRGEKVFYLIRPTSANLALYETWLNASNQSELFFGDQVDSCYKCVIRQGQTIMIPKGWIHAVFTPIDSLGEKVFYLIRPTSANLALYETWLNASNQSELFFGDQVDSCYKCVIRQGQTIMIPTGWIHAVFTPIDSLVFGGNFLHSYNIPLQLEVYAIEKRVKTPEKYLFPVYETINWYAAKHILDSLREYLEENLAPPAFIFDGAKAFAMQLRGWTQRKDYIKTAKHEVPEHIQYGRLLKELAKDVKTCEEKMKAASPAKPRVERKSKKKKKKGTTVAVKQMQDIDILHQATQHKLQQMEREQKKNIYNFDEEDDNAEPMKFTRLPKPGFHSDAQKQETDGDSAEEKYSAKGSLTLKVSNGKIVSEKKAKKGEFQPFVSSDHEDSENEGLVVDMNPARKPPASAADTKKGKAAKQPKLKLKLSFHGPATQSPDIKPETSPINTTSALSPPPSSHHPTHPPVKRSNSPASARSTFPGSAAARGPTSPRPAGRGSSSPRGPGRGRPVPTASPPLATLPPFTSLTPPSSSSPASAAAKKPTVPPISTFLSPKSHLASSSSPSSNTADLSNVSSSLTASRPVKVEPSRFKSDLTLSDIINQSALSTAQSTLGTVKLESAGEDEVDEDGSVRRNIPTIRGGLNGTITDILEASGYGTETAFTVDDDINRAPSPSMREAIQGMLSMSQGGLSGMQLFSRAQRRGMKHKSPLAEEDEEEQLSKCYQDDEFVYPTLEMDEDEQEQMLKGHSKPSKDDTWNPKARVNISVPLGERAHREGVRKEAIKNSLEASSAKIASAPKVKRPYKKKPKLEFDVQPGTSGSSCLSPTHSGSAFRPGLKVGGALSAEAAAKAKKPKKGQATAKQRLGKILKIHKMGMF